MPPCGRCAPSPGSPDLVFTAQTPAWLHGPALPRVALSPCRASPRGNPGFIEWFVDHGYDVSSGEPDVHFEGRRRLRSSTTACRLLWLGHGHRSTIDAQASIADSCPPPARTSRSSRWKLVDDRFYHLDTCFCPLDGGVLLYYPDAFSAAARASIEARVPETSAHRVPRRRRLSVSHCKRGSASARTVIVTAASPAAGRCAGLARLSRSSRHRCRKFMKAGGSAKCLDARHHGMRVRGRMDRASTDASMKSSG